jgi:hypothetical protein
MSELVVASTHYGDFRGTASIDQADGEHLLRLLAAKVGLPKGYSPVGFSVSAAVTKTGDERTTFYHLTVYATDRQVMVAESGKSVDEYLSEHGDVPVFGFSPSEEIEAADLAELFLRGVKEFNMVLQTRQLRDNPMFLLQPR